MLAIIIPYYKRTFFDVTLKSLANQTDKRFKVYIGDDASTDNSSDLLEKYRGQFEFIYHRFETNLGSISLTQQWERCIDLSADEKWIMILGDDDVLGVQVVEEFYSNLFELENRKINVVRFASQILNEKDDTFNKIYKNPKIEKSIDFFFRKDRRNSLSEYIFKKEQVLKIGFKNFPLGWCSDILAVLEFSNFSTVYSINNAKVLIRISNESISGNNENNKLKYLASEAFLNFMIINKSKFFNKKQLLFIIYRYEIAVKRNRILKKKDWIFLFSLYVKNFSLFHFVKFSRRFVISLLEPYKSYETN